VKLNKMEKNSFKDSVERKLEVLKRDELEFDGKTINNSLGCFFLNFHFI